MLWRLLLKEMHLFGQVSPLMEKAVSREFILDYLVLEGGLPDVGSGTLICFLIFTHLLMGRGQVVEEVMRWVIQMVVVVMEAWVLAA